MQSDKIKYTAIYNKRFFTQLIFIQYYKRISILILTLGGFLSMAIGVGYLLAWNPFQFHAFPYFTILYTLFVALLPVFLRRNIQKKLQNHPFLDRPILFEFSSEGIIIDVDKELKNISWGQLYQIHSQGNAWVFYGTQHSFFYVVKNELSENDLHLLEQWIIVSSKLV